MNYHGVWWPYTHPFPSSDTHKAHFMGVDDYFEQWWAELVEEGIHTRSFPEPPATCPLKQDGEFHIVKRNVVYESTMIMCQCRTLSMIIPVGNSTL